MYSAEHFFCACGYNRGMRFSLRTLLIAIGAVPLLIGVVVWTLWPERGSPRTIGEFQQALKSGSRSGIESATYYCFVEGSPAKRYQSLLDKAFMVHSGDGFVDTPRTATVYEFTSGVSPVEGKCGVFVTVDGQPPVIVGARLGTYED